MLFDREFITLVTDIAVHLDGGWSLHLSDSANRQALLTNTDREDV